MPATEFEKGCLTWLAGAELPYHTLESLMDSFDSAEEIYRYYISDREELESLKKKSDRPIQYLNRYSSEEAILLFADKLQSEHIGVISIKDSEYPVLLKQIPDPPPILFYRGNPSVLNRHAVSMIGSRNASYKGLQATEKIAREFAQKGIVIISGMADGIDSAAHRGAILGGTPTAAVLGCGLDIVYPSSNRLLRDRILETGGVIISEYVPGTKPLAWHFPVRNRIISGLTSATLMMECKIKSGSMSTVRHALQQGREVYAYPGESGTPWAEGAHQLLREGANYFTCAGDVLDDLKWLDKKAESVQNSVCSGKKENCTPEQCSILELLKHRAMSFEELLTESSLNTQKLSSALTTLQIKGMIDPLPGKVYIINDQFWRDSHGNFNHKA